RTLRREDVSVGGDDDPGWPGEVRDRGTQPTRGVDALDAVTVDCENFPERVHDDGPVPLPGDGRGAPRSGIHAEESVLGRNDDVVRRRDGDAGLRLPWLRKTGHFAPRGHAHEGMNQ